MILVGCDGWGERPKEHIARHSACVWSQSRVKERTLMQEGRIRSCVALPCLDCLRRRWFAFCMPSTPCLSSGRYIGDVHQASLGPGARFQTLIAELMYPPCHLVLLSL